MTSASALDDGPSAVSKISNSRQDLNGESGEDQAEPSTMADDNSKRSQILKKRQLPGVPASSLLETTAGKTLSSHGKKIRTAVTRTHSPRPVTPAVAAPVWLKRVQKVTPTVAGIENAAKHLFRTKARASTLPTRCDAHSVLALPTECTYEACTLLSWAKDEKITGEESSMREDQLERLKIIASTSSVHIYLQHHNVKQMDQILSFPTRPYATKQNPNVRCAFNESRYLFQKLADHFWPGPVHIYLPPQSSTPNGILQANFCAKNYIGFRCPSHPLAVKILKQVHQKSAESLVLVGVPIRHDGTSMIRAKDVANKMFETPEVHVDSKVQILHGEERREIFAVPTCQFQDEWLEFWIVPEKRTIVLEGKSKRDVLPQMKELLRNTSEQNRIICSILQHWKVADHRQMSPAEK